MIHCGFVGILGLANVGKSTYLNHLLGEKISIVSSKPQTTRQSFTGIISNSQYQLIIYDAPGYVEAKAGLFNFLSAEVDKVIDRTEHLLVLVANDQKDSKLFKELLGKVESSKKPVSFLFTKADLSESDFVKSFKNKLVEQGKMTGEFSIKSKDDGSAQKLMSDIALSFKAEHHALYDPDMISLERTRDIVAEFIREQCFLQLNKEIPYGLGVIIKSFKREKGLRHIQANILIEKDNHKAIVIGKGGSQLKKIGSESRKKIEELLGEKVFLGLHVAFKKNWMKNSAIMKEVGYHHE